MNISKIVLLFVVMLSLSCTRDYSVIEIPGVDGVVGTVAHNNGTMLVAGATVTLTLFEYGERTNIIYEKTTSTIGEFSFENIPDGDYELAAAIAGLHTEEMIQIRTGKTPSAYNLKLSNDPGTIGIVVGDYDDIDIALDKLGYTYVKLDDSVLRDWSVLKKLNMLFICSGSNCSDYIDDNLVLAYLNIFTKTGGTLYISGWDYGYFANAFPDEISFREPALVNVSGVVDIEIKQDKMRWYLETDSFEIIPDTGYWSVITDVTNEDNVLSYATFSSPDGSFVDVPASVFLRMQDGRALYSAYGYNDAVSDEALSSLFYMMTVYGGTGMGR